MRARRGFTLMELLIAMTLIGVVALSFAFLYTAAQRFLIQSINASDAQGECSFAIEHIKRNVLLADEITFPAVGQNDTGLTFRIPRLDQPGEPANYWWNEDSRELMYVHGDVAPIVLERVARGITAVDFSRPEEALVIVRITARTASVGDARTFTLETTVSPRGMQEN